MTYSLVVQKVVFLEQQKVVLKFGFKQNFDSHVKTWKHFFLCAIMVKISNTFHEGGKEG